MSKNIILNGGRLFEVLKYYYNTSNSDALPLYGFIAKPEKWDGEVPDPTGSSLEQKKLRKNIIFGKKIYANGICPIVPRRDWTSGVVYDYSSNSENLFEYDSDGKIIKNFYVRNSSDQVFRCICNNNGSPSTIEPEITPSIPNIEKPIQLDDGYKWIYVTSMSRGNKVKFFDDEWMPISISPYVKGLNPLEIGYGRIDAINVLNGGSGYEDGYTSVTVNIKGDGDIPAKAYAVVEGGVIKDVVVTESGGNYTYANVEFSSTKGSGASAEVILSPVHGSAHDPCYELGCNHVMLVFEFIGDEGGMLPEDVQYTQIGLLASPTDINNNDINGNKYVYYDKLKLATGPQKFQIGETIYQGRSLDTATYKASVCSIDNDNGFIYVVDRFGTPETNAPIIGASSNSQRILLNRETPVIFPSSGLLIYQENVDTRNREKNNNEQFRVIIRF